MKKFLSIVLSIAMILGTMSTVVFADATEVDIAVGDGQAYTTWSDAINNAADTTGDGEITYGVYGKVVMDALDIKGDGAVKTVNVIGMDDDAELEVVKGDSEWSVITVSDAAVTEMNFYDITLTRNGGKDIYDAGHHNTVFTVWLRYSNAGNKGLITYTDCVFPGGSGNNQYGKTSYTGCDFYNPSYYALWIYSSAQAVKTVVTVDDCYFEAQRGVKIYTEDQKNIAVAETSISRSEFAIENKPAIVSSTNGTLTLVEVDASACQYGLLATEFKEHDSSKYELAEVTVDGKEPEYVASYRGELYTNYDYALSEAQGDETAVKAVVAKVDGEYFTDMAAAIGAIADNSEVTVFAGTYNNALTVGKSNVTVKAEGDVTFTAAPSFKGENYHVEGINFEFEKGGNLTGSGLIKDCTLTATNNIFRYCYGNGGRIEFNGCTLTATGTAAGAESYAIHWDQANGSDIVFVNCSITGKVALGADLNSFSATGTDFNDKFVNIWGTVEGATFNDCDFNNVPYIFTGYDEDNTVEFIACETNDGSNITDILWNGVENTNATIIVDGAPKTKVAKIGDVYYKTLQAALDSIGTTAGDYTINLIADSDEDVIIHQTEGVNITIKGGNNTVYTGTMDIYGNSRYTGTETVTIDGVNFDGSAKTEAHDFIRSDFRKVSDPQSEVRYAHNVTVQNCHFEGSDVADVVAMRFRQGYNIVIKDCTANKLHSFMWSTGTGDKGVLVDNLTATNCKEGGISVAGGTPSTVITNSNITVTGEYGYGVRADANGDYDLTIEDTTIDAYTPVLLRNATSSDYTMNSADNTFTATNPYGKDIIATKTDYNEENTEIIDPDVDITLNTGKADEIEVVFEKVAEDDEASDLYNINLVGANAEIINRLNSGDLTFVFDPEDGKNVDFEIIDIANDDITVAPVDNSDVRYRFNFKTKTEVDNDTANTITIAQVKFEGYGKFSFKVKEDAVDANNKPSNVVHATKLSDNIVDTFVVGGKNAGKGELIINNAAENTDNDDEYGYIDNAEITVPTRELTINIEFPNTVENNVKAYQNMTVTIVGGAVDIERELGTDGYAYNFKEKLPYNTPYTVTVKGAGYRTARYTVTLNDHKTLNFWNNVKDADKQVEVETGVANSATTKNFLAGDIVKDNNINIYDLSAVVSYFNTKTTTSAYDANAKYDLNRDGVIDSKDVAYVLVSWGE